MTRPKPSRNKGAPKKKARRSRTPRSRPARALPSRSAAAIEVVPSKPKPRVTREAAEPVALEQESKRRGADPARFPVVGLGASAGGLSALGAFLQRVPRDSGMAYVVVTHQSPDRTTLLPSLLAGRTELPVLSITDGMRLEPNHVYVAPPGFLVTVRDEGLHTAPMDPTRTPPLPIDHTFRSMAHYEGDQAVGIILSGNGSDGTLGITEIKSCFGLVMAQEPETAQYTGMPNSAIATQLVDHILPPEQMMERLLRYMHGRRRRVLSQSVVDDTAREPALTTILAVLRKRSGSDFSAYKKSTIGRRIERRMHLHGIEDLGEYARFLEHTTHEVDALFKELLISVTSFFRDPPAFEALAVELAKLVELKPDGHALRVWIPGCATGEEAYSIAILIKERLQRSGRDFKIQIFATDLDPRAVELARIGRYPEGISTDLSAERLQRFFTREQDGYRVKKEVRELIVFAVQDLTKDPPFTRLDLVSCRNVLIYFESDLQKRVLGFFRYALRPGGLLLLGTSEGVSGFDEHFVTVDQRWKLFQRLQSSALQVLPGFLPDQAGTRGPDHAHAIQRESQRGAGGLRTQAEKVLLNAFVPASVIVSERGELMYVHGRTGMFFEPASGEPSQNVFDMAREGLRVELLSAMRQAGASRSAVVRRGLQVRTNGGFSGVTLIVRELVEPEVLRGAFVLSFETEGEIVVDAGKKGKHRQGKSGARIAALEQEFRHARENLQGMIEELETSNEELKSTNEELQSTNEELQSATEELETSREEMQSLNEELQTVNAELEERNRALSQANDDMQNLLNSTAVATVFLDEKLAIKRFTVQAKAVFRLIDSDIGRPISDLAVNLRYEGLLEDAQEVLRTLVFREREIQTKEGAWRLMRIMPYRTHENLIDGLVITFVDIDRLKRSQRSEKASRAYTDWFEATLRSGLVVLDQELQVISANRAFYSRSGAEPKHVIGQPLQGVANGVWAPPDLMRRVRALLERSEGFEDFRITVALPNGETTPVLIGGRRIPAEPEGPALLLLTIDDETERADPVPRASSRAFLGARDSGAPRKPKHEGQAGEGK